VIVEPHEERIDQVIVPAAAEPIKVYKSKLFFTGIKYQNRASKHFSCEKFVTVCADPRCFIQDLVPRIFFIPDPTSYVKREVAILFSCCLPAQFQE
jgi:hypothetical protein